jgi:phosphatidylserine/phosphatidylglycerophosphate/cardiolipin synthase-like enzyme
MGSTNWTSTGLCTQTNNTITINNPSLAKRYLEYWKQLKNDTVTAKGIPKNLQSATLRTWGATGGTFQLNQSWFSPNTPKARSSKKTGEKCPPDMNEVISAINKAKHAILFLVFYPGSPSIANWSALALRKNKDLFIRGCVTNKSASQGFYYDLKGITPPKKVKGQKTPVKQDYRVFGAEAFDGTKIPKSWQKEILNAGFAIIHDKVMVIDPFSKDCVVITGSHNLGYKASYDNDENLIMIKGNKKLAMAYTTHILDVYDHFSFRYWFKKFGTSDDYNLEDDSEKWLGKYFDQNGKIKNAQLNFWMQGVVDTN